MIKCISSVIQDRGVSIRNGFRGNCLKKIDLSISLHISADLKLSILVQNNANNYIFFFSAPSVSPFPSQSESTLGSVDYEHVKKSLAETKQSRGKYIKFSEEDRFTIGRYAAVHGPLVRKFKDQYPNHNESSVRTFT